MPKEINPDWESEWVRCKPYIEKAVKYQDSYTIEDIEDKIREGIFLLWAGKTSAYVTEFVVFPQYTAMNLLFCGGPSSTTINRTSSANLPSNFPV